MKRDAGCETEQLWARRNRQGEVPSCCERCARRRESAHRAGQAPQGGRTETESLTVWGN